MREWVITNGIGGYAASTDFGGMNTRKYHGLLVASLNPPGKRRLVLSKLDESITIDSDYYALYTNDSCGVITNGHNYQTGFEKSSYVTFTFKINDVKIEKNICLMYGKNAVVVYYRIENQDHEINFSMTPIVNFRNFHYIKDDNRFNYTQIIEDHKIQLFFDDEAKVNMGVKEGKYNPHREDFFRNMHYSKEEERGFSANENHIVPGTFEVFVKPYEIKEFTFVCSIEGDYGIGLKHILDIDGKDVIKIEQDRINKQVENSRLLERDINNKSIEEYSKIVKDYIVATDNFIVKRDYNKLHTIIAGYPWFLDWGRDTLISFEGLLLIPKRYKLAEEILRTFLDNIKEGLVPNGFSEEDGSPLYNSADASLLLFEAIYKYLKYTKNFEFLRGKYYNKLRKIIDCYIDGIDIDNNNIIVDEKDFLVNSGTDNTQNTWMDARVNGMAVTPRNGKAVEINALWYNALKVMQGISAHFNNFIAQMEYSYLARKCQKSFEKEFFNDEKKSLYDVINGEDKDDKVRPNQLFALSLSFPVMNPSSRKSKEIFITITKDLLTKFGLRTLASYEPDYAPKYEGDGNKRDMAYHQGTVWPWLLGPYFETMKNMIRNEKNKNYRVELGSTLIQFKTNVAETFINEIENGNSVGTISEVYDAEDPKEGKGAFAQAWSVSEIFKIIFDQEDFEI